MSTLEDIIASVVIPPSRNLSLDETIEVFNEKDTLTKKAADLTNKFQAECKSLKEKLSSLEKERVQARKEVAKLKEDNAAATLKITKLKNETKDVQYKLNNATLKKSIITQKEQDILKQNEEELHAYKTFTGIRWNFVTPDNIVEGLITNSKKDFVKAFQFDKAMPNKKLRESLWKIIKEAGSESWNELDENKENQM